MRSAISSSRAARWLVLPLCVVEIAGCGGGGSGLSGDEKLKVASYEAAIASTVCCSREYARTLRGVDYLIALCRKKADAKYDERTVKQVLEDNANDLRPYRPQLASQLDRVLDDDCE